MSSMPSNQPKAAQQKKPAEDDDEDDDMVKAVPGAYNPAEYSNL